MGMGSWRGKRSWPGLDRELRGACGHRAPVHTEARLAEQAGVDGRAWEAMSSASKGLESQEKTMGFSQGNHGLVA